MKLILFTLIAACFLNCGVASAARDAGEGSSVAVNYIIRSLSVDIGSVSANPHGTATDNDFRAEVGVNVPLLFFYFPFPPQKPAPSHKAARHSLIKVFNPTIPPHPLRASK